MYRRVCWEYGDLDELHHCDIITMQNEMSQTEPRATSKLINCSLRNGCICSDYGWRTALCRIVSPSCKMSSPSSPQNGHVNQSQQIWGVFHLVVWGTTRRYIVTVVQCIFLCILCTGHRSGSPESDRVLWCVRHKGQMQRRHGFISRN